MHELKPFLDQQGRLTALPAKRRKKLHALYYLAQKLDENQQYTESDINGALGKWHTFQDPATLRREMYNHCLIGRSRDGKSYWVELPRPELEEWIQRYI